MSLLSSIGGVRCLADEEADHNMLQDLQLAAELGKTLLERNKELENYLKQQQNTIDEQIQEIEYMKKQTTALREVNDSRLRVYEQLEVSIQEIERANHRLILDNASDKKQIKSQAATIESLELRCEDLQKQLDELTAEHETLLRRHSANDNANNCVTGDGTQDGSIEQDAASSNPSSGKLTDTNTKELTSSLASDEEVTELLRQLHEARNQRAREQKRVAELEEQLNSVLQDNASLEEQITIWRNKAEHMKSLQDEINTLEEVRQGHLCGRCLRGIDNRTHDALSIMLDQEEDDDISLIESLTTDNNGESGTPVLQENNVKAEDEEVENNPYRVLVEKYEALLEVQRQPAPGRKAGGPETCMSLQEELVRSGDFSSFTSTSQSETKSQIIPDEANKLKTENETQEEKPQPCKKPFSGTPTDLSEAESSSSGFSDETSNKSTQTDDRSGSLLCSIADGEDCKFSIYDEASPIESRFRKTPEYRQLFREIFVVLKRAAEAKDEGEKLPLLDDANTTSVHTAPQIPCTISHHFGDDNQSVVSSVIPSVVSEPPNRSQTPVPDAKTTGETTQEKTNTIADQKSSPVVPKPPSRPVYQTPMKRHSLEYITIGVNIRKKTTAKKNSPKKLFSNERPTTPDTADETTNSKIVQGKTNSGGRRKFKALDMSGAAGEKDGSNGAVWNGNTVSFFPSKNSSSDNIQESPNTGTVKQSHSFVRYVSEQHSTTATYEFRPSAASAEVARLKRLEMSYAEALRMPNKPKININSRRH